MSVRIKPKEISKSDIEEILQLTRKDITASKLKSYFAIFGFDGEARFQPNDTFVLLPNKFYNKTQIQTTVGRYIFNMFALPIPYLQKHGYFNKVLSEDNMKGLEKQFADMLLNDELDGKEYATFMDNAEWLGMGMCYYISPSMTKNIMVPMPEVEKRKEELFDQYKTELEAGDINVVNKVEKELISLARQKEEEIDDPSYDLFKCGAFNFDANYKKCSIMIGATNDPQTNKVNIIKSNYVDGLSKTDYSKAAALTIIGGTARGVATQKYGYETKKFNSSLQNVELDADTLDCGTTMYLTTTIPPDLKELYLYRFVIDGSEIVELTKDNIDNYVGKEVKLRSPMYCKGDNICVHCAGTLFKRMGLKPMGLLASNMSGRLLNLSMKAMHDSTIKFLKLDIDKYIHER